MVNFDVLVYYPRADRNSWVHITAWNKREARHVAKRIAGRLVRTVHVCQPGRECWVASIGTYRG